MYKHKTSPTLSFMTLPHRVQIIKAGESLDAWGVEVNDSSPEWYDCKISTNSRVKPLFNINGEQVDYSASIFFRGYVDVTEDDTIRYYDPNGKAIDYKPFSIKYIYDLAGNIINTKVVI
jgi:hypothetical protein